ncbi:hypothetical protein [Helicobacter canis]|uniref:Uncharacterized protein n=1 Tax=Helicobacter canis TaxID=29419 RepID=A0A5M9QGL7_9HELI|nr:hypothetical protein [Helicobacter canis]KAA8707280.1 hypothetical protein F4V45_09130 [Helicobacter canis]
MAKANKQYTLITYQAYSPTSTAHILESNKLDSSVKAPFVIARLAWARRGNLYENPLLVLGALAFARFWWILRQCLRLHTTKYAPLPLP